MFIISFSWKHEIHPLLSYVHIFYFNFIECFGFPTRLLFTYLLNLFIFYVLCIRDIMFLSLKKKILRGPMWKKRNPRYFSLLSHPSFILEHISPKYTTDFLPSALKLLVSSHLKGVNNFLRPKECINSFILCVVIRTSSSCTILIQFHIEPLMFCQDKASCTQKKKK